MNDELIKEIATRLAYAQVKGYSANHTPEEQMRKEAELYWKEWEGEARVIAGKITTEDVWAKFTAKMTNTNVPGVVSDWVTDVIGDTTIEYTPMPPLRRPYEPLT